MTQTTHKGQLQKARGNRCSWVRKKKKAGKGCLPMVETAMNVGMLGLLWLKVVTLQL